MGRNKKTDADKQKCKMTIWLTENDKRKLTERAGSMPVSQYFRHTLLKGRVPKLPPIVPPVNMTAYLELCGHIKILKRLSDLYLRLEPDGRAEILRKHAEQILETLERYRGRLLSLEKAERNDKQD